MSGRHELAVREMRRAETLNPQSVSLYTAFALCLRNARCYKEGAEKLRRALVLQPDNPTALQGFNWFVPYLKNYEEAEAACLKAVEITKRQNLPLYAYGYALATIGRHGEARKIAKELEARRSKQYVPSVYIALIHTTQVEAVGSRCEEALKSLSRAIAEPTVKNNPIAYSYEIAAAYALLDEKEKAAEWLKIVEKSRANNYNFAAIDARFERIRR